MSSPSKAGRVLVQVESMPQCPWSEPASRSSHQ